MKKLLVMVSMLFLGALARAGVPIDQSPTNYQGPYWDSTLYISSVAASGQSLVSTFTAVTKGQSGYTASARICLTKLILQMTTGTTFYLIDGSLTAGTTIQTIFGAGLGSSGTNTLVLTEDHLGPLCGTAGNALTLNMPAPSSATVNNLYDAEGFVYFPPNLNAGR
jgi:hypothetical protein